MTVRMGTYYRYLVAKKLNVPLNGNRVLDIGCYDGFLLSRINARLKFGIDTDPVQRFPDIEYVQDDFLEHDFNGEQFDRIFALDVIEHVKEDKTFIKKIEELLASDGLAILSVPSKTIKIFPSFLQQWVDKRWGHLYRRGYSLRQVDDLAKVTHQLEVTVIQWNCPVFRFLYLPISSLWRASSSTAKLALNWIVNLDSKFQEGNNGFLYIIIEVKQHGERSGLSLSRQKQY